MTAVGIPANPKQIAALIEEGEGPALEFKRSTGKLKEGMQRRARAGDDPQGLQPAEGMT